MCPLLQGFDEFMNLVLDEAEEVFTKTSGRKKIGVCVCVCVCMCVCVCVRVC